MPSIFDFVAYVKCFYSLLFLGLLTASTVLAITGKFFASIAFALIYMVTSEIFPTNARYLMVLLPKNRKKWNGFAFTQIIGELA